MFCGLQRLGEWGAMGSELKALNPWLEQLLGSQCFTIHLNTNDDQNFHVTLTDVQNNTAACAWRFGS
jgi:hypothetical protein